MTLSYGFIIDNKLRTTSLECMRMSHTVGIIDDVCNLLRRMITRLLQETHVIWTNKFGGLVVAMISVDIPSFRFLVAMVAELASLNILHHNTLHGGITISNT